MSQILICMQWPCPFSPLFWSSCCVIVLWVEICNPRTLQMSCMLLFFEAMDDWSFAFHLILDQIFNHHHCPLLLSSLKCGPFFAAKNVCPYSLYPPCSQQVSPNHCGIYSGQVPDKHSPTQFLPEVSSIWQSPRFKHTM